MNIRKLSLIALAAAFSFAFGTTGCATPAKTCPKKQMALQLYSIRNIAKDSPKEAFKLTAETGFTAAEAAWYTDGKFYNMSPKEYGEMLRSFNLDPISSHVGKQLTPEELASGDFSKALEWWKKAIADHKAADIRYMVQPWMPIPDNLKDLETCCKYLNAVGKLCAENGIKFGYHNHATEFKKVEGKVAYEYMLEHTDPKYVFFQMDVYWTTVAHFSPVDLFKKYPGRFKLLHIKDLVEIGQSGMVGFDAIFRNIKTAGTEYIVVEHEGFSYTPRKSLEISRQYLQDAPFVPAKYTK